MLQYEPQHNKYSTDEPCREKTNKVVSKQVRRKPSCTSTEAGWTLEILLSGFIFCLFVLRLNVPVNNFSVMSGRSKCFMGLISTVSS